MTLRRTAKQVRRYSVAFRAAATILVSLVLVTAIVYAVSYFYDRYGSFSVAVNKYDMVRQGLSLSETPEFMEPTSRLNARAIKDITNIAQDSIPANVDMINGDHNGSNYIAYTFYLMNTGQDTLTYEYAVNMPFVNQHLDEAIRVELYVNGESTVYAKTKSNGSGAEYGTTEFLTANTVMKERKRDFAPNATDKFTVVIWLEGDDPDCTNALIGGSIRLEMQFDIVEGS